MAQSGTLGLKDEDHQALPSQSDDVDRALSPHAVLIENVPGFVQGKNSALPIIKENLAEVNRRHGTHYKLSSRLLDAAEFGVPQHRRRAIVIALRDGADPAWPVITHRDHPMRAWDALQDVCPKETPNPSGKYASLLA